LIAGRLSDYKDAERAPTDLAAGLYAILRQGEAIHLTWGKPDLSALRRRLIAVVTALRVDIDAGNSRTAQAAVEDLSDSFQELENTDAPEGYKSPTSVGFPSPWSRSASSRSSSSRCFSCSISSAHR
jgi:hypothetical protein